MDNASFAPEMTGVARNLSQRVEHQYHKHHMSLQSKTETMLDDFGQYL